MDNKVATSLGLLIIAIIGVTMLLYALPPQASAKTTTETSTATIVTTNSPDTLTVIKEQTATQTIALPSTVTTLVTTTVTTTATLSIQTVTSTVSSTSTITLPPPGSVTIWGNATSKTILSTAVEIDFSSGATVYKAAVKGGTYSISLPNQASYSVTIQYTFNPTGASSCYAGPLPLNTMLLNWQLNWSC